MTSYQYDMEMSIKYTDREVGKKLYQEFHKRHFLKMKQYKNTRAYTVDCLILRKRKSSLNIHTDICCQRHTNRYLSQSSYTVGCDKTDSEQY